MDWATVLKDYSAFVTGVLGLIGIVLTYFLTKKHYQTNREFDRRTKLRDTKVEEIQSYIKTYIEISQNLMEYEIKILTNNNVDEKAKANLDTILELWTPTKQKFLSIVSLYDKELTEVNHELVFRFSKEV